MLASAIRNISKEFDAEFIFCGKAELDITTLELTQAYLEINRPDVIINCAAYTNVEGAELNTKTAYDINTLGAANIARAVSSINARLIHISTDAVYDGSKKGVYYEGDSCNPLSAYSKSKYAGEQEVVKHSKSAIILRTSWLYSLDKPNFVTAIINKARTTGSLNVVYDQLGTPTYTYDLAATILQIIKSGEILTVPGTDIYHYSNEGAISWYDFAVNICRILDIDAKITPVTSDEYNSKVQRPFHAIMSKTKIKKELCVEIPYWLDSLTTCLLNKNDTRYNPVKE